ncbi:MAG: alpha/beta hydrolase [Leptolyngbyaceae cyanobacterium CRU_2_3]|nr:alpha/beta hydrolase [Leptolyngbyaceae cyanobacterium CRU_2_3]
MIFLPSAQIQTTPEAFNLPYEKVWIAIRSGSRVEQLYGWWIPGNSPDAPVVLHFHGNAVNIGANLDQADRFHQLGWSVLLMDYRGYGQSEGNFPQEKQVYQDAEAMWNYLTRDRHIPPEQIILYGHSLGGAIAIELATHHPNAAGLIVESSFTSIRQMIDRTMNLDLFPVDLLLTQRFNSINKVAALQVPVLFIHGTADQRTLPDMSAALYEAAPQPKQLYLVPAAGHNDVGAVGGAAYLTVVQNFLRLTCCQL